MLYKYILENYQKDEPIFLNELPGKSQASIRQEMKKLVDEGKIERLYNGVYYLSYTTILGTKGKMSFNKYLNKKFLNCNGKATGYITGMQLANIYGFTSQNPSYCELCSNEATTKQRKLEIDGRMLIVYKPVVEITDKNISALQFLDLMTNIDKYSEIENESYKEKLQYFVSDIKVDFEIVKKYISLYPDRVFRNIYEGGLMNELV